MSDQTDSNVEADPVYDPYGRLVYSETDREVIRQLLDSVAALTPGDTDDSTDISTGIPAPEITVVDDEVVVVDPPGDTP